MNIPLRPSAPPRTLRLIFDVDHLYAESAEAQRAAETNNRMTPTLQWFSASLGRRQSEGWTCEKVGSPSSFRNEADGDEFVPASR